MQSKDRNERTRKRASRQTRVRKGMFGSTRPRVTVYRSAKHIYAQLVDPEGKTLASASTRSKDVVGDLTTTGNVEAAKRVGAAIAKAALDRDIKQVVFNRNGFLYHGRVKALADAAREGGLEF